MKSTNSSDKELAVLQNIYSHDSIRQRDLANVIGLSLGMTNAIVKRLIQKGFLTVRRINNRNLRYAITTDGIEEIAKRSYRYFKRTIKNVVYYKKALEIMVREAKACGHTTVVLAGTSDLDFILEHCCHTHGMIFRRDGIQDRIEGEFVVVSEDWAGPAQDEPSRRYLKTLIAAAV